MNMYEARLAADRIWPIKYKIFTTGLPWIYRGVGKTGTDMGFGYCFNFTFTLPINKTLFGLNY